ncbi:hypothetical protein Tco_0551783 [Tanacetum coccineum]
MDDRMGDIDTNIFKLSNNVEELTDVLLAHHHIDHTRYDSTQYSYVPNIHDLGVQQGVNFMDSPQYFSTAHTPSANPFVCLGLPVLDLQPLNTPGTT